VVATLRRGLNMLGKDPAETEAFFNALMRYHEPVLRLRRLRSAMNTDSKLGGLPDDFGQAPFDSVPIPLEPPKPRVAEQPWLGQAERKAAGFHEDEESGAAEQITGMAALEADFGATRPVEFGDTELPGDGFAPTQPPAEHVAAPQAASARPVAAAPAHEIESEEDMQARTRATLARLRAGDWVDLRVRNAWRRAQLRWTNEHGSLFMFVSRGGRSHGMTRRTCEKLIRARFLRLVDAGAVVDKALRSLTDKGAGKTG
jgi:hypothetical protein